MGRRFRFRGELSAVDVELAVASSRTLQGYAERLSAVHVNGRPLGRRRARTVLEHLLLGALDRVGGEYTGRFDVQMEHIGQLRAELQGRYQRVLDLFRPGAPPIRALPADLHPSSIGRLFDDLEHALDDLERRTSRDGLTDAMDHVDGTRDAHDLLSDVESRAGDATPPVREPDLGLDSPDEDFSFRVRGEHDRAALARYRERMRLLPESQRARAAARADAVAWAADSLPEGSQVTIYRVPDYSEGNLAALARFRDLDPRFSGRGYEVQVRLPDGTTLRPDGIRFFDGEGRRYQFLESKEPYTWTENNYYNTPQGQGRLRGMLERDARIAQQLRGNGCQGFAYQTGHPELDRFIAEAITDMRDRGVGGADLLLPPGAP